MFQHFENDKVGVGHLYVHVILTLNLRHCIRTAVGHHSTLCVVYGRDGRAREETPCRGGASTISVTRPHKPNASIGQHPLFQWLFRHRCSRPIQLSRPFNPPKFQLCSLARFLIRPRLNWRDSSFYFSA